MFPKPPQKPTKKTHPNCAFFISPGVLNNEKKRRIGLLNEEINVLCLLPELSLCSSQTDGSRCRIPSSSSPSNWFCFPGSPCRKSMASPSHPRTPGKAINPPHGIPHPPEPSARTQRRSSLSLKYISGEEPRKVKALSAWRAATTFNT